MVYREGFRIYLYFYGVPLDFPAFADQSDDGARVEGVNAHGFANLFAAALLVLFGAYFFPM